MAPSGKRCVDDCDEGIVACLSWMPGGWKGRKLCILRGVSFIGIRLCFATSNNRPPLALPCFVRRQPKHGQWVSSDISSCREISGLAWLCLWLSKNAEVTCQQQLAAGLPRLGDSVRAGYLPCLSKFFSLYWFIILICSCHKSCAYVMFVRASVLVALESAVVCM